MDDVSPGDRLVPVIGALAAGVPVRAALLCLAQSRIDVAQLRLEPRGGERPASLIGKEPSHHEDKQEDGCRLQYRPRPFVHPHYGKNEETLSMLRKKKHI